MAFFGDNEGGAWSGLKGEGVAPAVTLAPLRFRLRHPGRRQQERRPRIRGPQRRQRPRLTLALVSIVGADLDQFALAGDECSGEALAPGAECLVRVRFTPDSAGAKAAKLRIGSDFRSLCRLARRCRHGGCRATDDQQRRRRFAHPRPPPAAPLASRGRIAASSVVRPQAPESWSVCAGSMSRQRTALAPA